MEVTRRDFMGMAGTAAAMAAIAGMGGTALADEQVAEGKGMECPWCGPGSAAGDWEASPAELLAIGGSTMPLDELNRRRRMYVDAQTEYVRADGTVVPEVYVKARALLHTYGFGVGNDPGDTAFDFFMLDMSEDEAQAYVDMPLGRRFTATEFAEETGRSVEECQQYCDALFNKAWLARITNSTGVQYFHVPFAQGAAEYHIPEMVRGQVTPGMILGGDDHILGQNYIIDCFHDVGSPFVMPVPCSPSVVKDGAIDPFDDVEKIWAEKKKFSLSPCFCRTIFGLPNGLELPEYPDGDWNLEGAKSVICDHDLYTCLSSGEEAEFWIDHGIGKEITYEEAMDRLHLSVEQGMIIETTNSRQCETICSCHGDCCGVMNLYRAAGPDGFAYSVNMRRYDLEVNTETCIKCGTCMERCPMQVIEMDAETGYPVLGGDTMCMSCGQCAYVCPTKSRWLVPRDPSTRLDRFPDIVELNNRTAADRFERGLIW